MARALQVDYDGHSYRWFNVDDMMEVHGTILTELLVEGLSQYFHVPAPHQVLCDREGPIASSSDIRRTLQSLAPRLWLFDSRRMGAELRAQCQRRIEDISLEIGASKQRISDNLGIGIARHTSPPPSPPSLLPWVTSWADFQLESPDSARSGAATHPEMPSGKPQSVCMVRQPSFGDETFTPSRVASDARLCPEQYDDGLQRIAADIQLGMIISRDNSSTTELRRRRLEYPSTVSPSFFNDGFHTAASGSTCDLRRSPDGPGFGGSSDVTRLPGGITRAALAGVSSNPGVSSVGTLASCDSSRQCHNLQPQSPNTPELGVQFGSSNRILEVVLRKSVEGQVFGFTNVPEVSAHGKSCLRITKVNSSGLLAAWNALYPAKSLGPGDRIISVNGISEDLAEMRELLCGSSARLLAEKYSFEDVAPVSASPHGESLPKDRQKLFPVDVRAERLQHQISKAEERMSQGTSKHSAKSPSPWQPNLRNDLLEKERRIEELEQQLLLWQLSEPSPGKASLPEWRRPWRQGDDRIDDGSTDGEKMTGRPLSAIVTPNDRLATSMSDSPSREDQDFLRQELQRKVDRLLATEDSLGYLKVSAPVQIETIQTQADKDKVKLQERLDEQAEEMAIWKKHLQRMEQQVADLAPQRRGGAARTETEEVLLIRFPSVPLPPPPNFESHLPVCLAHLGATRVADLSMNLRGDGDTVIEIRGPLPALEELCSLPLQDLQVAGHRVGEVWREYGVPPLNSSPHVAAVAAANRLSGNVREASRPGPSGSHLLANTGDVQASSQFYIGSPATSLQPGVKFEEALDKAKNYTAKEMTLWSLAELEALRASKVEAEHRQNQLTDAVNTKNQIIQELQAKLSQSKEGELIGQARKAEEEARQQAKLISEMKEWELREQQLAAETEERQRRRSLARAAERDEDARELRMLRQRESVVAREAMEQQEKMQELQSQHSHAQQCAQQAQEDGKRTARELQEWQLKHAEEMKVLEMRALSSQEDTSLTRKKAIICEEQVQHLEMELRKQEAIQENLHTQDAATSNLQTHLAEQLEQLKSQEEQMHASVAEEIYRQEEKMLMLEAAELQEQQLVAEVEMECENKAKETQHWQLQHTQEMHALERQRSEADAAMRSTKDLEDLRAKELAAKEQRIKELEAQMTLMALQPAPPVQPEVHEEDLAVAVEAGPPDYVAVATDDELDVRLAEEIAALGTGILRGETLTRTSASKYKLADKKIFLKVIDGNIHVRDKGNHILLASWLSQIFAETPAGDDEDLMANMSNPWAEHM